MNYKNNFRILSYIFLIFAIALLFPLLIAIFQKEGDEALLFSITSLSSLGLFLLFFLTTKNCQDKNLRLRDSYFIVSFTWISFCLLGSIPLLSKENSMNFFSCFFELVSGFTTTGSTVYSDVENLGKSILFYRSLTSFLGGVGVIVLFVAITPLVSGNSATKLSYTESVGLNKDKMLPKARESAKSLYLTYITINLILIVILCCLGLNLFDSICISFSTIATSGFSLTNDSITHYNNPTIELTLAIFMLISSLNFSLIYFSTVKRKPKLLLKDTEARVFIAIVLVTTIMIALSLFYKKTYPSLLRCFSKALFHESSIISTTGFSTAEITSWPLFSKFILFLSYFIGGCQGSTAGGIKVIRYCIIYKIIRNQIKYKLHPNSISSIQFEGSVIEDKTIREILSFIVLYLIITVLVAILLCFDNEINSLESALSCSLLSIGNVGLDVSKLNMPALSNFSKFILSIEMLLGRMEIFPLLVIFKKSFWKR